LRNPPQVTNNAATLTLSMPSYEGWEQASHQRLCKSQTKETGLPTVPDQGIIFDHKGLPRDTRPEQRLKRCSVPPVSGKDQRGKEGKRDEAIKREGSIENCKGLLRYDMGNPQVYFIPYL
jgi:hypothetical protein